MKFAPDGQRVDRQVREGGGHPVPLVDDRLDAGLHLAPEVEGEAPAISRLAASKVIRQRHLLEFRDEPARATR